MKGSPSSSTGAMLAEAFSPKHTSAVCEGPISSDPLPVMKHKLFNRNQLRTTERLPRRRYFPVKSGALNRNPRSFPRGRRWKRSGRGRPLLFLRACFERFHFFFGTEYRLACTRLQLFLEQAIGKFRLSTMNSRYWDRAEREYLCFI